MSLAPTCCLPCCPESASEEDEAVQKGKHGGSRNRKSYGEKLLALEAANIRSFLQEKRCYCGGQCLHKLNAKGEEGVNVVRIIRAARFASKIIHSIHTTKIRQLRTIHNFPLTPG